jgi:hypothetical protein
MVSAKKPSHATVPLNEQDGAGKIVRTLTVWGRAEQVKLLRLTLY